MAADVLRPKRLQDERNRQLGWVECAKFICCFKENVARAVLKFND
jgi:hypothetical protein